MRPDLVIDPALAPLREYLKRVRNYRFARMAAKGRVDQGERISAERRKAIAAVEMALSDVR